MAIALVFGVLSTWVMLRRRYRMAHPDHRDVFDKVIDGLSESGVLRSTRFAWSVAAFIGFAVLSVVLSVTYVWASPGENQAPARLVQDTPSSVSPPSRAPAASRESSRLLERPDESCKVLMARTPEAITALQLFCGPFEPGLFEGAGADGLLLNLWVTESLARDLQADRMQARQSMTDMVNLWGNLIDEDFPAIRVYWGDVLILTARGRARGVEVKFEQ